MGNFFVEMSKLGEDVVWVDWWFWGFISNVKGIFWGGLKLESRVYVEIKWVGEVFLILIVGKKYCFCGIVGEFKI